jgi:MFS family permease
MSQDTNQAAEYQFSRKQIVWGLVAIFAVYGTVAYSVQTMNIARPKITADLNGLSLYGWSVSIPSLVMAMVTIIFGKFSDIYGRRIMLMISLVAAFIGTVLSALSPNFIFLIVASAIAALGAGAMMPLVFAVVGDLFPPSERSKWVGLLYTSRYIHSDWTPAGRLYCGCLELALPVLAGNSFAGFMPDYRSRRCPFACESGFKT